MLIMICDSVFVVIFFSMLKIVVISSDFEMNPSGNTGFESQVVFLK